MIPDRMKISKKSSEIVTSLKGKLGMNPNILCRIALALSIENDDKKIPATENSSGLEFTKSTLFGDTSLIFEMILLKQYGEIEKNGLVNVINQHIESGLKKINSHKSFRSFIEDKQIQKALNAKK